MVEFIRPTAKIYDAYRTDPYADLVGVKIFRSNGGYPPDELKTPPEIKERYKKLEQYEAQHFYDEVGELLAASGEFLRRIKLHECLQFKYHGVETYLEERLYFKPQKDRVTYTMYKGFKFNKYGNHVSSWFTKAGQEVFDAPVPQKLDEDGNITLVEDHKKYVVVNYTHSGLIQQETKDAYVSRNGRYIKYKGKNYYIREE